MNTTQINPTDTQLILCDYCIKDHRLDLGASIVRLRHTPAGTHCDLCDTPNLKAMSPLAIVKLCENHGIDAHVTLTNTVRARDVYTYRDDNNHVQEGFDWVTLSSHDPEAVWEFLGY